MVHGKKGTYTGSTVVFNGPNIVNLINLPVNRNVQNFGEIEQIFIVFRLGTFNILLRGNYEMILLASLY